MAISSQVDLLAHIKSKCGCDSSELFPKSSCLFLQTQELKAVGAGSLFHPLRLLQRVNCREGRGNFSLFSETILSIKAQFSTLRSSAPILGERQCISKNIDWGSKM